MDVERIDENTWWRVEFNGAGSVVSCDPVEKCERTTRTVLYIRAASLDHAQQLARRWYEKRCEESRNYERRRRAERKATGRCYQCTAKICAESSYLCAKHLKIEREYQRAQKDKRRAQGTPPRQEPIDFVAKLAHDVARRERYRRMMVQLPVILAVFDQLDGRLSSPFRQWLIDEIAQRGGFGLQEAAE